VLPPETQPATAPPAPPSSPELAQPDPAEHDPTAAAVEASQTSDNIVAPASTWAGPSADRHAEQPQDSAVIRGWFFIPSTMKAYQRIRCDYVIPVDAANAPLATAADTVLVCPFPTEHDATTGPAQILALRHGFSLVALEFPDMGQDAGTDRTRFYYYPESGSAAACILALDRLRVIAGFPKRKCFVFGLSGGGSMAHLFADAEPGAVDAVAQESGRHFPATDNFMGPMLLLYGEHDHVAPEVEAFTQRMDRVGANALAVSFRPNWGMRGASELWTHGLYDRWADRELMWNWFDEVANLRLQDGGAIPSSKSWLQHDGRVFPGPKSLSCWVAFPRPVVSEDISGISIITAQSAYGQAPRAVVILLGGGPDEDAREVMFDGIRMADRGFTTLSCAGEPEDILPAMAKAWSRLPAATQALPAFVVQYDMALPDDRFLSQLNRSLRGIVICSSHGAELRQAVSAASNLACPVTLVSTDASFACDGVANRISLIQCPVPAGFVASHIQREEASAGVITHALGSAN